MNEAEYLMKTYEELWRSRRVLSVEAVAYVALRPCLLALLAMFLAIFSPSSYSWNELNVHKCSQPKQLNLDPRSSRLTVQFNNL